MPITFDMVETALEHLWDYAYLGDHPLGDSVSLAPHLKPDHGQLTHLARGQALSRLLQHAISQTRAAYKHSRSRERHYYGILDLCYVQRQKNAAAARQLSLSDRTFYRYRKQAVELIRKSLVPLDGQTQPD